MFNKRLLAGVLAGAMFFTCASTSFAGEDVTVLAQEDNLLDEETLVEDELLVQEEVQDDEELLQEGLVEDSAESASEDLEETCSEETETTVYHTGYVPERVPLEIVHNEADFSETKIKSVMPKSYVTTELPGLRDQSPYGTCWAFASMSLVEINLMKKGIIASPDLSELHLAYFAYNPVVDPLGGTVGDTKHYTGTTFLTAGGNYIEGLGTLANWLGAADEAVAKYGDAVNVISSGLSKDVAYNDAAHIQNYYYESVGLDEFRASGDVGKLQSVKRMIYEKGAAGICFTVPDGFSPLIDSSSFSTEFGSFYNPNYDREKGQPNHAVVLVGWDDDFPASNFPTAAPGNGAFLVRNSWTTQGSPEKPTFMGYFWMSYYEPSLYDEFFAVDAEETDNYDNNYQYDGGDKYNFCAQKAANVFTAHAAEGANGEVLKAVAFSTNASNAHYTIEIYTDVKKTPDSGMLVEAATTKGVTDFAGYYTVKLKEPVELPAGTKFAVVVAFEESGCWVGREDVGSYLYESVSSHEGESYMVAFNRWRDMGGDGKGNAVIKAFTDNVVEQETGLRSIKLVGDIAYNSVTEKNYRAYHVVYDPSDYVPKEKVQFSSSDPSVTTINDKGVVRDLKPGLITISASVDGKSDSVEHYSPITFNDFTYKVNADRTVTFTWNKVVNAEGYRLFRNGSIPVTTVYHNYEDSYSYTDDYFATKDKTATTAKYGFGPKIGDNYYVTSYTISLEPGTESPVGDDNKPEDPELKAAASPKAYIDGKEVTGGEVEYGALLELETSAEKTGVFYTIDGTKPVIDDEGITIGSTELFQEPIRLIKDVTVKAFVWGPNHKASDIATFTFNVKPGDWGDVESDALREFFDYEPYKVPSDVWYSLGGKCFTASGKTEFEKTYTGSAITLADDLQVFHGKRKLVLNRDYTLSYKNNKVAAEVTAKNAPAVTITGKGSYKNKATLKFGIEKADLADAKLKSERNVTVIAGRSTKLGDVQPVVTFNGKELKLGTDYTLLYKESEVPVKSPAKTVVSVAGKTYTITVVAKEGGNFDGELSEGVVVKSVSAAKTVLVSKLTVTNSKGKAISVPYNASEEVDLQQLFDNRDGKKAKAFVKNGKKVLTYGEDYTVEAVDTDLRSAGKHQILIKGAGDAKAKIAEGKNAYVGEKYVYLQVTGKSLSKVKIAGLSSSVQYTGHAFELAELFNKKDKALSAGAEEVTLYATVNGQKTALVRSTDGLTGDYTVTMTNSGNLGSFNVVFKGINGYTGTVKKKITVKQYDLGKDSKKRLSIVAADAEYSAAGAASEVTVTYDNGNGTVTLTEGIDYLLSYKNNKNSAASTAKKAPTVVVKGIGNFTGTNSKTTFNVTKADAAKLSLSVNDVKYNASAKKGYYLKTPKVVDEGATVATNKAQGIKIVGGYKYSYDNDVKLKNGLERKAGEPVLSGDKLMPGTVIRVSAKITCPASSNYFDNGETVLEGTYKVIEGKNDLSKCKVVILNNNKLSYSNGNQIYLIKGKDFKVTTKSGGKTVTLSTNDYEIVSIKNNKFLGTATVVLRGKGNYGGTKKFTFKIGAKSIS